MGRTYYDPKHRKSADRMALRMTGAVDPNAGRCALVGCSRPVQTAVGQGFSSLHCHYHIQFKSRHGSFWKATYRAEHLEPYRRVADRFLARRWQDGGTEDALHGLHDLLNRHARQVDLPRLRVKGRSADEKVRAAIWRMREAGVKPRTLLRDHLAITAAVYDDFRGDDEFRLVQIAKRAARLAAGFHKRYDAAPTWHVYQRSSGRFLRLLGAKLEEACGAWTREVLDGFLIEKRKADRSTVLASASQTHE